jgi:hypothetical protein
MNSEAGAIGCCLDYDVPRSQRLQLSCTNVTVTRSNL